MPAPKDLQKRQAWIVAISNAHKGRKKGPRSDIHREHLSEALKGLPSSRKGMTYEEIYGIDKAKEARQKISEANKGHLPWNTGKKRPPFSQKWKDNMSKAHKGKKKTKEHIRKTLQRRIPSFLEKKFQKIINKYDLPYKYVGDGSFILESYNPDFINTNGEKIAIEVYARFYKQLDGRNIEDWKQKRQKIFNQYGWQLLFFDETEIKEENVIGVLSIV